MPNARPLSSPPPPSSDALGTELVLVPIDERRPSRVSDPSGVRLRPISSLPPPPEPALQRPQIALRTLLALGLVCAAFAFSWSALVAMYGADLALTPAILIGFGLSALVYLVANVLQALLYRPTPGVARSRLPAITVIVPAHDEGARVHCAIESAIESGYPLDRLEIIAIDDGSRDDTWDHLCLVADAHPDLVKLVRQPRHRGTREALRTGFIRASGAFVVTVEASANVAPGALEALVAPMIEDATVAAVAGRALVLNRDEGMLSRLLSARLALSFDLSRAAQSLSGAVLSTPLTLSAYRTEAVLDVLGRWSSQTFLGRACTFGEDRALTSELLRAGFRSVYQRTAVAQATVPTTFAGATQLLVRTERSNLREDLLLLPLLFGAWRRDRIWPAIEVLFELGQYPLGWLAMTMLVIEAGAHPMVIASVASALLVGVVARNLYFLRTGALAEFGYGVGYSLLAALGLWWVVPYSLASAVHRAR